MYKVALKDGILEGLFSASLPCWRFSRHAQYSPPIANFDWIHIKKCWSWDGSNLAKFHAFITKVNNSAYFWTIAAGL